MAVEQCEFIDFIPGTADVGPEDATDFILVGRALTPDGDDIERGTKMRAWTVGEHFVKHNLVAKSGLVVCSANRTPPATTGTPWRDSETGQFFPYGIPEAEGHRRTLLEQGLIPPENIIKQQDSFETVGDVRRGEDTLLAEFKKRGIDPANRVVLFAAQKAHLERIFEPIAPHTMRLPYIGGIVPEEDSTNPDSYPVFATWASHYVVRGLKPEGPDTTEIIERRAKFVWNTVLAVENMVDRIKHLGQALGQPSHPSTLKSK